MKATSLIKGRGYVLHLFSNGTHDPAQVLARDEAGRFCTYVGTLIYKGYTALDATKALLEDIRNQGLSCLDQALGNYCFLLNDDKGLHICTDRAGLHHVYHTDDLSFISNSFVSAACSLKARQLRSQEVLEYILCGATFGSRTLLENVTLLGEEILVRITLGKSERIHRKTVWEGRTVTGKRPAVSEVLSQTLERLDWYYSQLSSAFGSNVTSALSGGYDSRLNLALMMRQKVSPKLFVYGSIDEIDVQIAKLICRNEDLQLLQVDRRNRPQLRQDEYWHNQESVFHGLDGLTQYGFACEPFELSHRTERATRGVIVVNGGGGEIWRDFWKLPNRAFNGFEFARAYFAGRIEGLHRKGVTSDKFLRELGLKIDDIAGSANARMNPQVVQSLYPRLRLRYWQGKNNSVDNFLGYAITPFSEHVFTVPAMWIPIGVKREGWFERQMICQLSSRLSQYPTSHGHSVADGPNLVQRLKGHVARHLPTSVRAWNRRVAINGKRRYFQTRPYVIARFGTGPLAVEEYVQLSQIGDSLAFSRALTVERMLRDEWF